MFNAARFATERPHVIALATLLALAYGALSYQALPRQENPTIQNRYATVLTYLPGADPEKVELLVTKVLEDHIAEVPDVEQLSSRSGFGRSFLMVEVAEGAPAPRRLQEIEEKVQQAVADLPKGASRPLVETRLFRTNTIVLVLSGRAVPDATLREHAIQIRRGLERLPDIRRVEVRGLPEEEIRVDVDVRRIAERGLRLSDVVDAIAARNVRLPGGEVKLRGASSGVRVTGAFGAADEIGDAYVPTKGALPARLRDVARVDRTFAEPKLRVRHQGEPAVAFGVEMLPGKNAVAVGERIRAFVDEHRAQIPSGMDLVIVADEPAYISARLSLMTNSLLMGLGLVVALAVLGMGWRSGLVVSASIPLSLAAAFGLQGLLGISLHQISIAALVIAIGIVVDDAIVVTDCIHRRIEEGAAPERAAVDGLEEVHLAVLASSATTVAAFVPLMVMQGDIGAFIRSIPVVVTLMLASSLAVAHFVTPLLAMYAHRLAGDGATGSHRVPAFLHRLYARTLAYALRRPVALLATALLVGCATLAGLWGYLWPPSFFPSADRHQFLVELDLPPGAAYAETLGAVERSEARLASYDELLDWTSFVGGDVPKFYYNEFDDGAAENIARILINTRPTVAFSETGSLAARVERDLRAHVPGALVRAVLLRQGYGRGHDIEIFVTGDEIDELRSLSREIREVVAATAGVSDAWDSFGYDPVTIEAQVDEQKAAVLGISHRNVAATLRSALDGVVATGFREDDEEIDVRVRLPLAERSDLDALASLPVWSETAGQTVPLAHVAHLEAGWATREILRYGRRREAMVSADLRPGASVVEVGAAVERRVRGALPIPPGYHVLFQGQRKEVTKSFLSMARATTAAVFLIYIILVLRFRSLFQPVLILLALPMALVGSSVGLAATGNPLSFMSILGAIALAGVAVNDSIVLVDAINLRREQGLHLREAVRRGTLTRVRPVLLTSLTTMGGLAPLSIQGGPFWAPFGCAMIFGLGASTLLTLVLQPAAYLLLEEWRARRARPGLAEARASSEAEFASGALPTPGRAPERGPLPRG